MRAWCAKRKPSDDIAQRPRCAESHIFVSVYLIRFDAKASVQWGSGTMTHEDDLLRNSINHDKWRSGSPLFEELSGRSIERLASVAQTVTYESDHVVFFQDDPGDALYMVERGSIEISVMAVSGKKLSLNIMCCGDVFGEIAVLDSGARTATATVLEPAMLLRVTRSDVHGLMTRYPEFAVDMIAMLCTRLRWVSQLVEDLGLHGVEERLASRLMILNRRFSDTNGNVPLSQSELADFLGATRESINKALRNWQDAGLIGLSRGSIRILDCGRLADLSATEY